MPRFPCATWRPIGANTGGILGPNLGLVLHHAVMNGSTWALFNRPGFGASAHFWVGQNGAIEQHVDSSVVAWHGISLNSRYVSVETEGCGAPPHADPMSDAMVNALARIYADGMRIHGWANALANANGQPGLGYHRMPGGVATACPCDIRLNMRAEILRRAAGGVGPGPTPPPIQEDDLPLNDADKRWLNDAIRIQANVAVREVLASQEGHDRIMTAARSAALRQEVRDARTGDIEVMMRRQMAPGNELFDRTTQATRAAIQPQ